MLAEILEILREQIDGGIGSDDLKVVPNRRMLNLYAVRLGNGNDYLVHTGARAVEKVCFDQWPPQ